MCGIAGIIRLSDQCAPNDLRARVGAMASCVIHRGPDDVGVWQSPGHEVAFAHRRLAIIDRSGGHQPMQSRDGRLAIVFNGEIYNFAELRERLRSSGQAFDTCSDTEVLLRSYEVWGPDCVRRLRGMFAFAIFDGQAGKVLLARDPVGKKPLFYAVNGGALLFASELQAVVPQLDSVEPDDLAVDEYLSCGYIRAPRTGLRDVRKLLPGATLTVDLRGLTVGDPATYWQPTFGPKLVLRPDEAEEALLEHLRRAVTRRLVSDVEVGALLSGGVDSSLVVALMAEQRSGIRTFSVGFDEPGYDERRHARTVAEVLQTSHHEVVLAPDAARLLPTLVRHYGEPYADSSAIATYCISQVAGAQVRVVLTGDGADELFGGYDRYLGNLVAERIVRAAPGWMLRGAGRAAALLAPSRWHSRNRLRQAARALGSAQLPFPQRYARWLTYFTAAEKADCYTDDFMSRLGGRPFELYTAMDSRSALGNLDRMLEFDMDSYLPFDLLVKMDIASMAHGVEARSPMLDLDVIEFATRLPETLKVRHGTLKYLPRRLAERFVPRSVVRRRKMGFGVPIGDWLRGDLRPLVEEFLLNPVRPSRWIKRGAAVGMFARHVDGHDQSFRLWSLLFLEMWYGQLGQPADTAAPRWLPAPETCCTVPHDSQQHPS